MCADASAYKPVAEETWVAGSTTAMAITGDIVVTQDKIRFANGATASLHHLANIKKGLEDEAGTFFRIQCVGLYAVDPPFTGTLLLDNTMCGAQELRYVTFGLEDSADELGMAAYTGGAEPILLSSVTGALCGTFKYFRP